MESIVCFATYWIVVQYPVESLTRLTTNGPSLQLNYERDWNPP